MKLNLERWHGWIKHITIALDVLFLVILLVNYLGYLPEFWNILYIFYFVLAVNTIFIAFKINKIPENKRENNTWIYLTSHLFILILVVIAVNQFLKRDIITNLMPYLIGFAIASGFLTFYSHQNKVEKELEDEKEKEEHEEKKRYDLFPHMFPTLAKIPIVRNIARWMYKEGWAFSIPFVIIAIAFIALKIAMPLIYNGSYIDEYYHILSGVEFFKTGHFAEFYYGLTYLRGLYLTLIAGFVSNLSNNNIFFLKLIPSFLGIINFFLLFIIAKRLINNKLSILCLLFIYSISYLIIFNHFYIRIYVFYEFFILLLSLLILNLTNNITLGNKKVLFINLSLIILTTFFVLLLSFDSGRYMILVYVLFGLAILFLFYFDQFIKNFNISKISFIIKLSFLKRIVIVIIFFIIILLILNFNGLLNEFTSVKVTHTTPDNLKYYNFFFEQGIILTLLFIISFLYLITGSLSNKSKEEALVIIPTLLLFIIHFLSSSDIQVTRNILYLLPLYYLTLVFILTRFKFNSIFKIIVFLIIISNILVVYPNGFLSHPYIPEEINYIDNSIYSDVSYLCKDSLIITAGSPGVAQFYKINPSYYVNTNYNDPKFININNPDSQIAFFDFNSNNYKETYTRIPLLINENELEELYYNNSNICYITGGLPYSWVNQKTRDFVTNNFHKYKSYNTNNNRIGMELYIKS